MGNLVMSILYVSRYRPSRGGHAPGDLRDAFCDLLEEFEAWEPDRPPPVVEVRGKMMSASALCGLLWNCTDILAYGSREILEEAGFEDRITYGCAARWLRKEFWPGP